MTTFRVRPLMVVAASLLTFSAGCKKAPAPEPAAPAPAPAAAAPAQAGPASHADNAKGVRIHFDERILAEVAKCDIVCAPDLCES